MNILIIWHKIPAPNDGASMSIYHLLRSIVKYKVNVTLMTFMDGTQTGIKNTDEIRKYCSSYEIIDKPEKMASRIIDTIKNIILSPRLFRNRIIPTWFYSRKMQEKTDEILIRNKFDLVYCSRPMLVYLLNSKTCNMLKILDFDDPGLYASYQLYLKQKGILRKGWWLLRHYMFKYFEVKNYMKFDACIFVAALHKQIMEQYLPRKNYVVHYGVDIGYFKNNSFEKINNSLIFSGAMDYSINEDAVIYFCTKILPLIKKTVPDILFYIVGKNPSDNVLKLASENIIITGFVDDIRPYFSRACVAVVPIRIDDGGFKLKILEAMAMNKAIVSTSTGAKTLEVIPGRNIFIADEPEEFANKVIELLNDEELRKNVGMNGRKLVEDEYSWDMLTPRLINIFYDVLGEHKNSRVENIGIVDAVNNRKVNI